VLTAHRLVFRIDEPFNPRTRQWLPLDYPARHLDPQAPVVVADALRRSVARMLALRLAVPKGFDARTPKAILRDVRGVSRLLEAKLRQATLVVKDPTANFLTSWLHREFRMRPVVLVRHPCGNAAGYLRMGWSGMAHLDRPGAAAQLRPEDRDYIEPYRAALAGDPVLSAALDWRVTNAMLLGLRDSIPDMVVVRYEDLADDPGGRFPALARQLGLPWGPSSVATLDELQGEALDQAELGGRQHVMKRDPRAAAWSWRDRLSQSQIDEVMRHAGPLAAEVGYQA
jgi:hypothetical protein